MKGPVMAEKKELMVELNGNSTPMNQISRAAEAQSHS